MYFIKDTNVKKINIKYREIIYTMRRKINYGAIRSQRGKITNFYLRYCLSLMYFIKDTNIKKINIKYREIIYTMRRKINCGAIRS